MGTMLLLLLFNNTNFAPMGRSYRSDSGHGNGTLSSNAATSRSPSQPSAVAS